jgi:hypothetical protein
MKRKVITRRKFLKNSTGAAIAGALYLNSPLKSYTQQSKKSRVVLIRNEKLLDKQNRPDKQIVQEMLDQAVTILLDEKEIKNAWGELIKPLDIVGIKTNVWSSLPTPAALETSIKNRILDIGVQEKNISIDDRGLLTNPVFLQATALINVRPMRTHYWAGVGGVLKNPIMFSKQPWSYHDDTCADLAKLWELPLIKNKVRLNILVLFTPLFHGMGPHHYNPQYIWPYQGMIVGIDPVAVDTTGVRILQAKRRKFFGEDRPLNPPAKHILLADTRHHLGTADPEKIELIKLGWQEEVLI